MKKIVLFSGLGPSGGLTSGDLKGTRFDYLLSPDKTSTLYRINGVSYDPLCLEVMIDGRRRKLLQKGKKEHNKALVTEVLENILLKNGIEFELIQLNRVWSPCECDQSFFIENVDIICLSTTFMWSNEMLRYVIQWINNRYHYKYLVLGGKYAALKKHMIMEKYNEVDFIISGDGEESLPALIKALQEGDANDIDTIPNLMYRNDVEVKETEHREIKITEVLLPKCKEHQEVVMYESMRGCVFSCKFCAWSTGNETFRYKTAEQVLREWNYYVKKKGVKEIQVIDSNFFMPTKRMDVLLEHLPDLGVKWKANARTDIKVSEKMVSLLEKSGCVSLKFGFESMSDAVLGYINKKSTAENNRLVNELFSKSNIDTIDSFIVGFPGETPNEYKKTEDYLLEEHYGHFHLYVFELEDKCMPIWAEKEKYKIELYEDGEDDGMWGHGGNKWSHCGMDYKQAEQLKTDTLRKIRNSSSKAVHRTWQGQFIYPLVPEKNRDWNITVEKYVDQLIYLPVDYKQGDKGYIQKAEEIMRKLNELGVYIPQ